VRRTRVWFPLHLGVLLASMGGCWLRASRRMSAPQRPLPRRATRLIGLGTMTATVLIANALSGGGGAPSRHAIEPARPTSILREARFADGYPTPHVAVGARRGTPRQRTADPGALR
jgi:hypothetical protein